MPPGDVQVVPLCRPISLKNESIEVMKAYDPDIVFGPQCTNTHKGRVAHMKADLAPDSHDVTPVAVGALLFPRFTPNEALQLGERGSVESFIFAAHHAFNYSLLGSPGFDAMAELVDSVHCFDISYSNLDEAVAAVNDLHEQLARL